MVSKFITMANSRGFWLYPWCNLTSASEVLLALATVYPATFSTVTIVISRSLLLPTFCHPFWNLYQNFIEWLLVISRWLHVGDSSSDINETINCVVKYYSSVLFARNSLSICGNFSVPNTAVSQRDWACSGSNFWLFYCLQIAYFWACFDNSCLFWGLCYFSF